MMSLIVPACILITLMACSAVVALHTAPLVLSILLYTVLVDRLHAAPLLLFPFPITLQGAILLLMILRRPLC